MSSCGENHADFGGSDRYPDRDGFFGSVELSDIFHCCCPPAIAGRRVAEIRGIGRFVNILAAAGAAHVVALEPSAAFRVLQESTQAHADRSNT
jgi:hypothetical protein